MSKHIGPLAGLVGVTLVALALGACPTLKPSPVVDAGQTADASVEDGGSLEDAGFPRRVANVPGTHRTAWIRQDGEGGVVLLSESHPKAFQLWWKAISKNVELELGEPGFEFETRWGTSAFPAIIRSGQRKQPLVFMKGLNPDRYPVKYGALASGGRFVEIASCEYGEPVNLGGSEEDGVAWFAIKKDCTRACAGPSSVAILGVDTKGEGGPKALGPLCLFSGESEPSSLQLHPTRQVGYVHGFTPYQGDGGFDFNYYLRMFSFRSDGATEVSAPFETKPLDGLHFHPDGRRLFWVKVTPEPRPGRPPDPNATFEVRQFHWTDDGDLVDESASSLSKLFTSLRFIQHLNGDRWAIIGNGRSAEGGVGDPIVAVFSEDTLLGLEPLGEGESSVPVIADFHGTLQIFWQARVPDGDGGENIEVWTRPLELRLPE